MLKMSTMLLTAELKKKIWNSPLQLLLGTVVLYFVAVVLGSGYACGPGNSDYLSRGAFTCFNGEMQLLYKLLIVSGIVLSSLCFGRAISVLEKNRISAS